MQSRFIARFVLLLTMLWPGFAVQAGRLPEGQFTLAAQRSQVAAKVAYLGVSNKTVRFPSLKGEFHYRADGKMPFELLVTADATQLDAGDATDTGMLKSDDFFDTARYRDVVFKGTKLTVTGAKTANVEGVLSVRNVSKPLTLKVVFPRPLSQMAQDSVLELTATARFKRSAYGMKAWPVVVGDKVNLNISARFERK